MALNIVTGPPASGKSTHIRKHRKPGDITIDYDELANTLAGQDPANHEHTQTVKAVTKAARDAAIQEALRHTDDTDVWIIHSTPSQAAIDGYTKHGANIITIDPGRDTVMKRIKTQRPKHMHAVAAKWYDNQQPTPRKGTTARGYGHRHMQQRQRLLRRMTDGEACQWCGKPMYKNKAKNFDGAALEADHSKPLLHDKGKTNLADRLLHRTCNRQRGAGKEWLNPMNKMHEQAQDKPAGQGVERPVFNW